MTVVSTTTELSSLLRCEIGPAITTIWLNRFAVIRKMDILAESACWQLFLLISNPFTKDLVEVSQDSRDMLKELINRSNVVNKAEYETILTIKSKPLSIIESALRSCSGASFSGNIDYKVTYIQSCVKHGHAIVQEVHKDSMRESFVKTELKAWNEELSNTIKALKARTGSAYSLIPTLRLVRRAKRSCALRVGRDRTLKTAKKQTIWQFSFNGAKKTRKQSEAEKQAELAKLSPDQQDELLERLDKAEEKVKQELRLTRMANNREANARKVRFITNKERLTLDNQSFFYDLAVDIIESFKAFKYDCERVTTINHFTLTKESEVKVITNFEF